MFDRSSMTLCASPNSLHIRKKNNIDLRNIDFQIPSMNLLHLQHLDLNLRVAQVQLRFRPLFM